MITHLACIMDGNRRWAKKHGFMPWDGHKEGVNAVDRTIDFCLQYKIPYLSLYTFSLENFNRPQDEQHFLFSILLQQLKDRVITDMVAKNVRILFVGDRSLFPAVALPVIEEIEQACKNGTALHVQLLFCYGGRQEIIAGVKRAAEKVRSGDMALESLNEETFSQLLWSGNTPPPEIIIRTGGAQRLSNFLLFQAAYSEFFFVDEYWPELGADHLNNILQTYSIRQRNFGA
jgi:undecaprenyl diphosphate synthase